MHSRFIGNITRSYYVADTADSTHQTDSKNSRADTENGP